MLNRCVVALLLALACAPLALGQSGNQGTLEGIIADASGAAVPGVAVRLRNILTSASFAVSSDENGFFQFSVLPLGQYELKAERPGFATLVEKAIEVTVGARIRLTLTLQVAAKTESVVVSGATPLIETTRSQVSATLEESLLRNLPVNGRDFVSFVLLTPGVTTDARGGLSFGGQRAMNSLLVDGAEHNDMFFGQAEGGEGFSLSNLAQSAYDTSLEAVEQFQVNANAYSAEFGRASGGVINAVTKSGTNQFHGSAFWFYRDRSLNANDSVNKLNGLPKDPFHYHQFGGVVGGPIRRDRLFLLFSYDGLRSNTAGAPLINLPSGFQFAPDPTIAGFQKRALDFLGARAFPWNRPFRQNDYLAKVDARVGSHQVSGRWQRQRFLGGLNNARETFEHLSPAPLDGETVAISLTSALPSATVNVLRFAYDHAIGGFGTNGVNPEANVFEGGQLVLTIGRASNRPQEITERRNQWADTLTLVRGRHTLKFGGDFLLDAITHFNAQNFSGSFRFLSLESFGRSLAGTPQPQLGEFFRQAFSGFGTPGVTVHPDMQQYAGFAQDEWRATRNMTFNIGLRYDVQVIARPTVKNSSPALAAAGFDNTRLGTDTNNFAPRLGLAWAPGHSGRMVLRAGYGIFFAPTPSILTSRAHFQNGVSVQTLMFSAGTAGAAFIPAYPNTVCGVPDPGGIPPSCPPPLVGTNPIMMFFSPAYRTPYTQQGGLGVETALTNDLVFSVSYLVVKGTHLQRVRDVNLGTPTTPTPIGTAGTTTVLTFQKFTLPRPIAGFDRIELFESDANSIYHGLTTQVRKRFAHNFQLMGSYTFSKVIDDNPNVYAVTPGATDQWLVMDPSRPSFDQSASANDQRHRFVLSGVWALNLVGDVPRAARAILNGWQLSGIVTAQSGQPYSGLVSFDLNNDGNAQTDRTPGLGRNTFYLPATVSFDPRVSRTVALAEHIRVQFIWEAFNVFNHANFTAVRTTQFARSTSSTSCGIAGIPCLVPQTPQIAGLAAFGIPTASAGPRIMQFAAKLIF